MNTKINYIKGLFSLIGKHCICTLGCILFIMVFPAMVDSGFTQIIYTAFALLIYFDLLFTCAWNIGDKHRKAVNSHNRIASSENAVPLKYNFKAGVVLSALITAFNIILCLICLLLAISETPWLTIAGNLIYKFWYAEYIVAFKYIVRLQYLLWFIIAVIPAFPVLSGYICGVKNVNFFEKLVKRIVYKKPSE